MMTVLVKVIGVSAYVYSKIVDMAAKVEWTANDYAAQNILADIVEKSGLSLRALEQKTGGVASHARIGYILNGERGPVKLSEFIAICEACGVDASDALQQVIDNADATQPANTDEDRAKLALERAQHAAEYGLAAMEGGKRHEEDDGIA